jgi:hypothetical protein
MMKHLWKSNYPQIAAAISLVLMACLLSQTGCGSGIPRSQNYFALLQGNSWLYQGSEEGQKISVEIKVAKPDPALKLSSGIMDVEVTGSLGNYEVSESGLFLEATPTDTKLWGVKQTGATPQFFDTPYIWLQQPLQVGGEYNTAIQGTPAPAQMVVTGRQTVATPWGPREGFSLEEKSGEGVAGGVRLVFVPYLGFTSISAPDWPKLDLKDASLK